MQVTVLTRSFLSAFAPLALMFFAAPLSALEVLVHYLAETPPEIAVLTELEERPDNLGEAGAILGLEENTTTGTFLDQDYQLALQSNLSADALLEEAKRALQDSELLILNTSAATLLAVADLPEAKDALIFNAGAEENVLRAEECRANVLHVMPSYSMRTDAIAQFINFRQWEDLALVRGAHPQDRQFADSLLDSLNKFGMKPPIPYDWNYDADMRRSVFSEGPLFSQDFRDKDMVLVADEVHDFARYLMYNTWAPQLFAGSEGLQSEAWASVVEQWGAVQLQNRFAEQNDRPMASLDYAAWAAMRAIGEAVTRINSTEASALRGYLLGDEFALAGFKGESMNFRKWNGQMRQPMPIFYERALVALAPMEGYLHQYSELDTLGVDQPQNRCTAFEGDAD